MRGLWLLVMIAGAVGTAASGQTRRCDPPYKQCGDREIPAPCQPCSSPAPLALEQYREALEGYRENVEALRARDPGGSLDTYRKGIDQYRDGQAVYRREARANAAREQ